MLWLTPDSWDDIGRMEIRKTTHKNVVVSSSTSHVFTYLKPPVIKNAGTLLKPSRFVE